MEIKLVVLSLLLAMTTADPMMLKEHGSMLADSTINLALNLYKTMVKDRKLSSDNILFSPLVVASSLGVMSLGAKDKTANQVKSLLNINLRDDVFHPTFSELFNEVSNEMTRNTTWKIGSRLYGPNSVKFRDDFVQKSKIHYKHDHSKINFRDKRSTIQSINEWASQATDGKLKEIIKDMSSVDGALFVNAMYFKPHWDEKFHDPLVDKRGFMVTRTYTTSVPMMHRTGLYNYYEDEVNKVQIIEMPLAHKFSSMILIMSWHVEPLERIEKLLTKEQLNNWFSKLQKRAMSVSLPKVNIEVSHELQKYMQELGLTEAVDKDKADFSGITGKKDLHLSNMLHATAVEWNTEGNPYDTDLHSQESMKTPTLFYADHPYIFLVRDKKTNSILLIGKLVKPKGNNHDEL
ncbi:serpin H1-like [Stegostoma tigrinum]|uniref:serpin H1-like n=1 Tax=Stegostoma tigrinum TaxID=3053191 RepID=UPI00202AE3E9|nr:serpin H1-like [Stegostoma tigrinum]XP_048400118.1 serpin H1-like [Stegostoma tigrinum]XP_048400119.1 serpin H1-like [Stegostoma tigrinum]XP_048400120.1 serpin H1-like [Stegostoma tigrinum]XP_048400121.1 serpin H1-like [Stegostoma tigrinum]XP_048400122.1 serpin H1-like [Stegostoma tigrinum]